MITGACLCGQVSFEVHGGFSEASLCHCSICRRATGSGFGAYGEVKEDHLVWPQGKALLGEYRVSDLLRKFFCKNCGSTIATHHQSWPEYYYLSLGCLDGNPDVEIEYHQFVDSKASWVKIGDELAQYAEWPDEDSD